MGKVIRDPNKPLCGAKRTKRGGEPCKQPAGYGTDHPGQGACKYHGGCSAFGCGPANINYKHGRRCTQHSPETLASYEEWRKDSGSERDQLSESDEFALFLCERDLEDPNLPPEVRAELLERIVNIRLKAQKLRGGEKAPDVNVNINARDELLSRITGLAARRRTAGDAGEPE